MRKQAAEYFVKTAKSGASVGVSAISRNMFDSQPTLDTAGRNSGKPGTAEGSRTIRPSDGYSTGDNAGLDPGVVPLPRTPDEASTASLKKKHSPYRFSQKRPVG
jgi:hypothetical protein